MVEERQTPITPLARLRRFASACSLDQLDLQLACLLVALVEAGCPVSWWLFWSAEGRRRNWQRGHFPRLEPERLMQSAVVLRLERLNRLRRDPMGAALCESTLDRH